MKKSLGLLIALLGAGLVLTACGTSSSNTANTTVTTDTNTTTDTTTTVDTTTTTTDTTTATTYTMEEVAQHDNQDDCRTVVNGQVADVTSFFGVHPGGDANLSRSCGIDATDLFMSMKKHDPNGYAAFETMVIGSVQ